MTTTTGRCSAVALSGIVNGEGVGEVVDNF